MSTTASTFSSSSLFPSLPKSVSEENISRDQQSTYNLTTNTVKPNQRGDPLVICNMERLYIPALNDDAKRDGPPRCVSVSLESSNTSQTGGQNDDTIMIDEDCMPLDYRRDWSKDMELSVSECLSSHPSLLLSPDDIAKTRSGATSDISVANASTTTLDQPRKQAQSAAWDTLSLSNWHIK